MYGASSYSNVLSVSNAIRGQRFSEERDLRILIKLLSQQSVSSVSHMAVSAA